MGDDVKLQAELEEARAKHAQAEAMLAQARKGCLENLIIKGLIPIALLVVGPAATWHFSSKAQEGISKVEKNTQEVNDLRDHLANMKQIVENLSGVLADASNDREHLSATVDKLDGTLKMVLVQIALRHAIDRTRGRWETESSPQSIKAREHQVLDEAMQQLAPLGDSHELEGMAKEALDKMTQESGPQLPR